MLERARLVLLRCSLIPSSPSSTISSGYSLCIDVGADGSRLSHSHELQYNYVLQVHPYGLTRPGPTLCSLLRLLSCNTLMCSWCACRARLEPLLHSPVNHMPRIEMAFAVFSIKLKHFSCSLIHDLMSMISLVICCRRYR